MAALSARRASSLAHFRVHLDESIQPGIEFFDCIKCASSNSTGEIFLCWICSAMETAEWKVSSGMHGFLAKEMRV